MTNEGESNLVTKEFLEEALKCRVHKFEVTPGCTLGDGFTCLLYSVDVWKAAEAEPLHILLKCYPSNPVRQVFLEKGGMFDIELGVYSEVIPELIKFQEGSGAERVIKPPFAPFLAGRIATKEERSGTVGSLDCYIMMTDLRKSGGFRVRDRFLGLDLDHYKLVIEAQATLHALSWAYKCKSGQKLRKKFSCLTEKGFGEILEAGAKEAFLNSLNLAEGVVKDDPMLAAGCSNLRSVFTAVTNLYFDLPLSEKEKKYTKDSVLRVPNATVENEEPWEVLLHGDTWSNNLMFRYDEVTGRPVEVLLVDLQLAREGDPFTDVNYTLYASTSEDLRDKHMKSLLHVYYDTFEAVCENFSVPRLPGWSWEEMNRRFHRAQIFGAFMGLGGLPIMLRNEDEIPDTENIKLSEDDLRDENFAGVEAMKKLMSEIKISSNVNPTLRERIQGALRTAVKAGVL